LPIQYTLLQDKREKEIHEEPLSGQWLMLMMLIQISSNILAKKLSVNRRFLCIKPSKGTVAVAMSGGIDSAVSALLLQDAGYDCVGVYMQNWDPSDECGEESCDFSQDLKDMKEVCTRLNIPSYEVHTRVCEPSTDLY
jgi:tRNA(Ile)-lysidine synthase TilS/MesJ